MNTLLIIAQSGQMLAQAASNIGLKIFVIDCFADRDTQALAADLHHVSSLAIHDINSGVKKFKKSCRYCLYGSGFEAYPETLVFLETHFELLGNSSDIFTALQNKPAFFQQLDSLNISYPTVYFTPPNSKKDYLIKPYQSLGGENIQKISLSHPKILKNNSCYYQRYLAGETLSILFLAARTHALIIGYNRQWTRPNSFVFSGIMNQAKIATHHQHTLQGWLKKLTPFYQLQGLCSLDFILDKDQCYLLEINPRPPASMMLYQTDLLKNHLLVCQNQPPSQNIACTKKYSAYQIIYTTKSLKILPTIHWPSYCHHIPMDGQIIPKDAPICSIIISENTRTLLLEQLEIKRHFLLNDLTQQHD
ncbi:MAG: ATP-grasp domain-containing protein [Methylococcales bacterium]|nr:ATP-grasp domain-containing protein [Methylococcales bacterium]